MLMVKLLITDDFSGVEKETISRVMWREGCWLITFFFLWASRRNWSSRSWRAASHQRGLASSQQVQNNWSHTERGRAAAHRWLSSNNAVNFMNTEFSSCACLILGSWFQLSKGKTWVRVHLFHHKPVRSLSVFWNIKKKSNPWGIKVNFPSELPLSPAFMCWVMSSLTAVCWCVRSGRQRMHRAGCESHTAAGPQTWSLSEGQNQRRLC